MKRFILLAIGAAAIGRPAAAQTVVVDFDDLAYGATLTGSGYAGLTWEWGNVGHLGNQGMWKVSELANSHQHSGLHNATNTWGSTLIGIEFPEEVDVLGAYFADQGGVASGWTTDVRVHGYRDGAEVATTSWFDDLTEHTAWFAIGLSNVDRIVLESVPVDSGGGWYGMDDLTYRPVPEPNVLTLLAWGGLAMLTRRRRGPATAEDSMSENRGEITFTAASR